MISSKCIRYCKNVPILLFKEVSMNSDIKKLIHESDYRTIGYDARNAMPHHDNSVEIIQFWSDGGYFITRNNIFPIKPGLIVIINAMDIHYSNPSNVDKYNRSKLIVSTDCFNQICTLCGLNELASKVTGSGGRMFLLDPKKETSQQADSLFKEAYRCFSNAKRIPTAQATIIDCVIRILTILAQGEPVATNTIMTEHTLEQMTNYINNQLLSWEDISLNGICNELHISRSYAAHLFKELTNKSMTQYVMDLRLSEAKKLLLTTDLKVFDIAEMLKFKDSTTFCKTFKKHTGYTPRGYRISEGIVSVNSLD
jgi:AraC-like DNA-binding protein